MTAGIFEKQQRTNFRLSARLHSILGSEHIGSYCFFRIGTSGPAPGYFAGHPVCQTRSALSAKNWDEISVDIRFLFADGSSPTRQKQTVYRSYPTYYAVLNHFHYWHIFSWRLPFETTWLTQEFFYRVKTILLYWPKIPCAYGKIRSAIQVRFFFIRMGKRLFLSVFLIALFAFLLLGLTGLFLFAGFYVCQIMALFQ